VSGRSAYNVGVVADGCPEKDWRVWTRFERRVPASSVEVMRALFERFCGEIQARGLPWGAATDGQAIGFKVKPGGNTFKIALHSAKRERGEFKPPSFLIHPGFPLDDRGVPNPYPDLRMFWEARYSAQGWSVFSTRQIPEVAAAVDLALAYGKP
jgi:hypothetical protein